MEWEAYKVPNDLNTKYLYQTMNQPDKDTLQEAMRRNMELLRKKLQRCLKDKEWKNGTLEWKQQTIAANFKRSQAGRRGNWRKTKHLNIKYHHFKEEVRKGTISIYHART
jgi:hypothetical protein